MLPVVQPDGVTPVRACPGVRPGSQEPFASRLLKSPMPRRHQRARIARPFQARMPLRRALCALTGQPWEKPWDGTCKRRTADNAFDVPASARATMPTPSCPLRHALAAADLVQGLRNAKAYYHHTDDMLTPSPVPLSCWAAPVCEPIRCSCSKHRRENGPGGFVPRSSGPSPCVAVPRTRRDAPRSGHIRPAEWFIFIARCSKSRKYSLVWFCHYSHLCGYDFVSEPAQKDRPQYLQHVGTFPDNTVGNQFPGLRRLPDALCATNQR